METRFIEGGEFVDKATYIETRDKLSSAIERIAKLEADLHKYNTGQWSNPPADQYCPDCQCGRCIMREVSDDE